MLMGTSEKGQRQDGLGALLQRSCQGGAQLGQRAEAVDFVGFTGAGGGWSLIDRALAADIELTQCRHIDMWLG